MKVLTFIPDLSRFDRYVDQFNAIAERVDSLTICYFEYTEGLFDFSELSSNASLAKMHSKKLFKAAQAFIGIRQFVKLVKHVKPDIVYGLNNGWMTEYARIASEKTGKPLAIRVRGNPYSIDHYKSERRVTPILRRFTRGKSFAKADVLIPVSVKVRNVLKDKGFNVSETVESGVDLEKFPLQPFPLTENFVIGYAGRFSKEKGCWTLLRIAEQLNEEEENIEILFAGDSDYNTSIYPSNMKYLGRIKQSEMSRKFYSKIHAFLLPSYTEGIPLTGLEAYATGRPVIAWTSAFPQELIFMGAEVHDYNVTSFVYAIRDLKDYFSTIPDEKAKVNLAVNIRKRIEKKTWDEFGRKTVEIFEELK